MYYLEKVGLYGHGIFWIGTDLEEGKAEADRAASADADDYHKWRLYRMVPVAQYRKWGDEPTGYAKDADNELVYTGQRIK